QLRDSHTSVRNAIVRGALMITRAELTQRRQQPTDKMFFSNLETVLISSPLMVVGWSISEPYIIDVINGTISEVLQLRTPEELTIVDIEFNGEGHTKARECYQLDQRQVFMALGTRDNRLSLDDFFLWIQARYAFEQLLKHAPQELQKFVAAKSLEFASPLIDHPLIDWFDDFLPSWTRTCWRAALVSCAGYQPHEIRLELADLHIPWDILGVHRPDLAAATVILSQLSSSDRAWNFSFFPGAFWQEDAGHLVLPLPAWGEANELAALGPLLDSISSKIGYVSKFDILPVGVSAQPVSIGVDRLSYFKDWVASRMRVAKFADANGIGHIMELNRI
ncbi:MAG: hypothetical protein AABZ02_14530, partial [Bacteroidota bacterium]